MSVDGEPDARAPRPIRREHPPSAPRTVMISPGIRMPRPPKSRVVLLRLIGVAILAAAIVGSIGAWAARGAAETEALREAAMRTDLVADTLVTQALQSGLDTVEDDLTGPAEEKLRAGVLEVRDGQWLVSVNLWREDGTILWSDDPELIGSTFPPPSRRPADSYGPGNRAAKTDLTRPENADFRGSGKLIEVYRRLESPAGNTLLLQTFTREGLIQIRTTELWSRLSLPVVAALPILVAVLLPLTWLILRRTHQQREALLRRSVDTSRAERHRVAGRLHDGAVQDVAAAMLKIDGLAGRAGRAGDPVLGDDLAGVAERIRAAAKDQRALLEDLYPPELTHAAVVRTIDEAAGPARAADIGVEIGISRHAVAALAPGEQELVRRVIDEALRNVARHSGATTARVTLALEGDEVVLEITDDGVGFDPDQLADPESGHLGTRVVGDLARDAGAELLLRTAPGAGTSWRLTLAAQPD